MLVPAIHRQTSVMEVVDGEVSTQLVGVELSRRSIAKEIICEQSPHRAFSDAKPRADHA